MNGEKRSKLIFYGLMAAAALAVFIAPFIPGQEGGMKKAAVPEGEETVVADSIFPLYSIPGIKNEKLSTALSGAVGVIIIFGAASFIYRIVKTAGSRKDHTDDPR
ncbi:hypothetical protein COY52_10325 [Candidatus Desantisbacteria bacterium CG_4_10_14_0_8_um_filter_48_22]|uniref:PDGLE domain-containing protein n=1 Tax=Candidatus Desantisbacteria bacterium CG_4_10_14_0_8_um_filter_48_22 TaxID=1974543 RepID=A0A2M7S6K3_9BACT|nr:MAG: hypothetical protein COY52_10325 [Candidatus Desantisbacteria bacterium CG_4_10_14_0_8_um_filter_48_22]